jgi:hypothetical protein
MIDLTLGTDETVLLEFFEGDETGAALDLSQLTVAVAPNSTVTPVPTITDAPNGKVSLFFSDTLLSALLLNHTYHFRLQFTNPGDPDANIGTPEFQVRVV